MTTIDHVGHSDFWNAAAGSSDRLEVLRYILKTYALDPRFTTLGKGGYRFRELQPSGLVHFWGNFYEASCVFSIDTDDVELVRDLETRIEENMASAAYRQAALDEHNHIVAKAAENARREAIRTQQRESHARSILAMRRPA